VTEQDHPWERLPEEAEKWFERFDHYRIQGPTRTLEAAWRSEAKSSKVKRPSSAWYKAAKRYRWHERAAAWDASQRATRQKAREEDIERDAELWRQSVRALAQLRLARGQAILKARADRNIRTADALKMIVDGGRDWTAAGTGRGSLTTPGSKTGTSPWTT
jgi:hypothetical protein